MYLICTQENGVRFLAEALNFNIILTLKVFGFKKLCLYLHNKLEQRFFDILITKTAALVKRLTRITFYDKARVRTPYAVQLTFLPFCMDI